MRGRARLAWPHLAPRVGAPVPDGVSSGADRSLFGRASPSTDARGDPPRGRRVVLPERDGRPRPVNAWLNVGCGTHRAPEPWVNVDVIDNDEVHPDVIRQPGEPMPFADGSAARVFAGHVLE